MVDSAAVRSAFIASRSAAVPLPFGALSSIAFASVTAVVALLIAVVASFFACSWPAAASAAALSDFALRSATSSSVFLYERNSANLSCCAFSSASRAAWASAAAWSELGAYSEARGFAASIAAIAALIASCGGLAQPTMRTRTNTSDHTAIILRILTNLLFFQRPGFQGRSDGPLLRAAATLLRPAQK